MTLLPDIHVRDEASVQRNFEKIEALIHGADRAIPLQERADPDAPPTNTVLLYARDNGAGKTQVCARFATGVVQVIATEP